MATIHVNLPTARGHSDGAEPYTTSYRPDGSPFEFVFRFYEVEHDDGRRELVCSETAIRPPKLGDGPQLTADTLEPITAPVVRDLANRWDRLEEVARAALGEMINFEGEADRFTAGGVRTRRVLSPEFLADIARRHQDFARQGASPTQALAREERVSVSTAKNWLRKAREVGEAT